MIGQDNCLGEDHGSRQDEASLKLQSRHIE